MEYKLCWLDIHKWGKWSTPVDTLNSYAKDQFRRCQLCGVVGARTFKHSVAVTSSVTREVLP